MLPRGAAARCSGEVQRRNAAARCSGGVVDCVENVFVVQGGLGVQECGAHVGRDDGALDGGDWFPSVPARTTQGHLTSRTCTPSQTRVRRGSSACAFQASSAASKAGLHNPPPTIINLCTTTTTTVNIGCQNYLHVNCVSLVVAMVQTS